MISQLEHPDSSQRQSHQHCASAPEQHQTAEQYGTALQATNILVLPPPVDQRREPSRSYHLHRTMSSSLHNLIHEPGYIALPEIPVSLVLALNRSASSSPIGAAFFTPCLAKCRLRRRAQEVDFAASARCCMFLGAERVTLYIDFIYTQDSASSSQRHLPVTHHLSSLGLSPFSPISRSARRALEAEE